MLFKEKASVPARISEQDSRLCHTSGELMMRVPVRVVSIILQRKRERGNSYAPEISVLGRDSTEVDPKSNPDLTSVALVKCRSLSGKLGVILKCHIEPSESFLLFCSIFNKPGMIRGYETILMATQVEAAVGLTLFGIKDALKQKGMWEEGRKTNKIHKGISHPNIHTRNQNTLGRDLHQRVSNLWTTCVPLS